MAARETDVMEDEILEAELWSSSALAISSGTEQLLMLEGFTDPSLEVYLSKHKHIFKNSKFMFNIHYLQCCLGGHFCLHVTSRKLEVSGWACPAADLPRTRLRLTDDVTVSSQWANFCHAKTGQAFCL